MSFIEKLFWNEDFIDSINNRAEKEKSQKAEKELRKELLCKMDSEQRKTLDKFCAEINIQNGYECERAFYLGFKAAMKLLFDSWENGLKT